MAKRKVKGIKPNNKFYFRTKSKDKSDELFAQMIDNQYQKEYAFQDLIEEQLKKMMHGN